ncbi:GDSL-type esterase/lipase family protein [Thorsellia kenyensis]|uniref:GDSL-type esterase/lipase family protein n=1 Tax=Thorsellia kenyensis TaxID=1549888 RepID=A0ABV6CIH3_9GAMM
MTKFTLLLLCIGLVLNPTKSYANDSVQKELTTKQIPTLLILGDSLSAGYRLSSEDNWPTLLNIKFQAMNEQQLNDQQKLSEESSYLIYPYIVNGSVSGDTAEQALARLPNLLTTHSPDFVLIELGANNGMQGLSLANLKNTLDEIVVKIKQSGAKPILMQIDIPQNLGKRYVTGFKSVYPKVALTHNIPLIPFYMADLVAANEKNDFSFIQDDGIHPTKEAQPFIVDWMMTHLVMALLPSSSTAAE